MSQLRHLVRGDLDPHCLGIENESEESLFLGWRKRAFLPVQRESQFLQMSNQNLAVLLDLVLGAP